MIAPLVVAGIAAAASVGGSLIGGAKAAEKEAQANAIRQAAMDMIAGIRVPTVEEQKLMLQHPEIVGEISPELERAISMSPSAMEGVSTDPRLQQAQMAALDELGGLSKGGLNDADKAALEQIRRGAAAQDEAKQQQILQEMQSRGQGGAGAELIARLKSSQTQADRSQQAGLEQAQMAQQRALQALSQQGSLAGSIRGQEFGEKSDKARAIDLINQFNTQNQQGVQQRNIQNLNVAQSQNLGEKQRISDQGTLISNQQQQYNKELIRQKYQDEMNKATAMANMMTGQAAGVQQSGERQAGMWGQIGNSVSSGIMGGFGGPAKK